MTVKKFYFKLHCTIISLPNICQNLNVSLKLHDVAFQHTSAISLLILFMILNCYILCVLWFSKVENVKSSLHRHVYIDCFLYFMIFCLSSCDIFYFICLILALILGTVDELMMQLKKGGKFPNINNKLSLIVIFTITVQIQLHLYPLRKIFQMILRGRNTS